MSELTKIPSRICYLCGIVFLLSWLAVLFLPSGTSYAWPEIPYEIHDETGEAEYVAAQEFYVDETEPGYAEKDRDRDMLNDEEESAIAEYFKPFLSFESWPVEMTRRPGEPLVLFQVRPVGPGEILGGDEPPWARCREGESLEGCGGIEIIYQFYWEKDGGGRTEQGTHHCGTTCDCGNSHEGDAQPIWLWLRTEDSGWTWRVEKA